jgi:hypothetical protein
VTRAARAARCFGGARLAAGLLAGCCAQRSYRFGSAQAAARNKSSSSCWSLWRCAACCSRLCWLLCAVALLFWLGTDQCPRPEKLELLVASAVRGLLLAPWPAAVRSSCTVLARHSPTSVTRAARAAGRFGSAWLAVGVFGRLLCAAVLLFLARRRPRAVT